MGKYVNTSSISNIMMPEQPCMFTMADHSHSHSHSRPLHMSDFHSSQSHDDVYVSHRNCKTPAYPMAHQHNNRFCEYNNNNHSKMSAPLTTQNSWGGSEPLEERMNEYYQRLLTAHPQSNGMSLDKTFIHFRPSAHTYQRAAYTAPENITDPMWRQIVAGIMQTGQNTNSCLSHIFPSFDNYRTNTAKWDDNDISHDPDLSLEYLNDNNNHDNINNDNNRNNNIINSPHHHAPTLRNAKTLLDHSASRLLRTYPSLVLQQCDPLGLDNNNNNNSDSIDRHYDSNMHTRVYNPHGINAGHRIIPPYKAHSQPEMNTRRSYTLLNDHYSRATSDILASNRRPKSDVQVGYKHSDTHTHEMCNIITPVQPKHGHRPAHHIGQESCRSVYSDLRTGSTTDSPCIAAVEEDKSAAHICELYDEIPLYYGEKTSIGSINHPDGCKPCVFQFNEKKGGCENGISCKFCHFPHTKRRKPPRPSKAQRMKIREAKLRMTLGPSD